MDVTRNPLLAMLLVFGAAAAAAADVNAPEAQVRTVIGPRNPALANGAQELLAGRAEEGIRLTEIGLNVALGRRERQAALGNLCAGYLMIRKYEIALDNCNRALAENDQNWRVLSNRALIYIKTERFAEADADLLRGEALAPQARTIREVRGMYMDAIKPVTPNIIIDDRRTGAQNDES